MCKHIIAIIAKLLLWVAERQHKQLSRQCRQVHDGVAVLMVFHSMKRFGHVISNHFIGRTVLNTDVAFFLLVRDKEVTDVKVSGSWSSATATIGFQQHCTHVVLKQNVLLDRILLGFQEKLAPKHRANFVIRSN